MFQCVVLAGGFGTRLKSISGDIPKPLVSVAGKPFLDKIIERLSSAGCSKLILSIHYGEKYFYDYLKSRVFDNLEIIIAKEESPLGTGGAIKYASQYIDDQNFVCINGDTFLEIDYKEFFDINTNVDFTIAVKSVPDASRYGAVKLNRHKEVEEFVEKGHKQSGFINAGVFKFKKSIFTNFKLKKFSLENDFIPSYKKTIKAFIANGYFIDIGIPHDYKKACDYFNEK